jgi:F0F1-type ATP synthase membrane subunit b/b'
MAQTNPILQTIDLTNQDGLMILVGTAFIYFLYFTLSKKVFAPLLEHLEHREGVTSGALHTAEQMRQKGQALRARYDEGLFQARVEANNKKNEILTEAKRAASQTIGEAEAAAAAELQAGRAAIEKQIRDAHGRIEGEAKALADTLAAKIDSQLTVH